MSNFSFEQAYARLEAILGELNRGETPLEKSLELYEEADKLIASCGTKLSSAEQKIQTMIKKRTGGVALTEGGAPELEPLASHTHQGLRE